MLSASIETMYKYRLPRLWGELEALEKLGKPLTVQELQPFDHYHYCGSEAIDLAIGKLALTPDSRVLDIGAGIGGTARYVALHCGCQVTGIELQPQLHQAAVQLTEQTGLHDRVQMLQGDFLEGLPLPAQYDAWLSLMVFLHIPDRTKLLRQCAQVLKPQGRFYIEDYYQHQPLSPTEMELLETAAACPYLPTRSEYVQQLESTGFTDIQFCDVTEVWRQWVLQRLHQFQARQDIYLQRHGADMVNSYLYFYQAVVDLFQGGNLGGARIWGRLASVEQLP